MIITEKIIEGIFQRENKNRFLCSVLISGELHECYIPSSSKLGSFINLKGKKVLLTENRGTESRTKYSIFAVKFYNRYIILNLNITNRILEEEIRKQFLATSLYREIYKEKTISGYKTDFYIPGKEPIIIEAKSIISTKKSAMFPTITSKRALDQLYKLEMLMNRGFHVQYYIISLSPTVKNIYVNNEQIIFSQQLKKCLHKGMIITGLGCIYENSEIKVSHKLNIYF